MNAAASRVTLDVRPIVETSPLESVGDDSLHGALGKLPRGFRKQPLACERFACVATLPARAAEMLAPQLGPEIIASPVALMGFENCPSAARPHPREGAPPLAPRAARVGSRPSAPGVNAKTPRSLSTPRPSASPTPATAQFELVVVVPVAVVVVAVVVPVAVVVVAVVVVALVVVPVAVVVLPVVVVVVAPPPPSEPPPAPPPPPPLPPVLALPQACVAKTPTKERTANTA